MRLLLCNLRAHRAFGVVAGIGALLLTTACSAEVVGLAGVSVDERGDPIAVVVACKGTYDAAHLEDVSNLDATTLNIVRDWSFSAVRMMRWNIVESPAATHAKPGGTLVVKPGVPYQLTTFSKADQTTSGSVTFTAADLAGLRPGQVRYFNKNESGGTGDHVVVDATKFESLACDQIAGLS